MDCLCQQQKISSATSDLNLALSQRAGYQEIVAALEGHELGSEGKLTLSELSDSLERLVADATLELDDALGREGTYCDECSLIDEREVD